MSVQKTQQNALMENYLAHKITDAVFQRYSPEWEAAYFGTQSEGANLDQDADGLEGFIPFADLALLAMTKILEAATPAENQPRVLELGLEVDR